MKLKKKKKSSKEPQLLIWNNEDFILKTTGSETARNLYHVNMKTF